jgi:hypothetical protein
MAERTHLDWFRGRLAASRAIEPKDPAPILAWREQRRERIHFNADLIGLDDVRGWSRDADGNVRHTSGQFFGVEGVRVESGDLREVASWDQPIYTQLEGGILALLTRESAVNGIEFLLHAKAEPGNIGVIQTRPRSRARGPTSGAPAPANARRWWRSSPPKPASGSSIAPNTMRKAADSGANRTRTSSRFLTMNA